MVNFISSKLKNNCKRNISNSLSLKIYIIYKIIFIHLYLYELNLYTRSRKRLFFYEKIFKFFKYISKTIQL